MAKCSDCGSENRDDARFCDACGAKIVPQSADVEPGFPEMGAGDEDAFPSGEDDGGSDSKAPEDGDLTDAPEEPEGAPSPAEPEGGAPADATAEPEDDLGLDEPEGEGPTEPMESTEVEEEPPAESPEDGYIVFPDSTEAPIPPSQWLIGRADLAKYLTDPDKANEISRGHITVFQADGKFYVEDGKTMVQEKPSANKTWLLRNGSRILVTGTGRNELEDDDEIDVAELVRLQFVVK